MKTITKPCSEEQLALIRAEICKAFDEGDERRMQKLSKKADDYQLWIWRQQLKTEKICI